jgi:hypothetical protein
MTVPPDRDFAVITVPMETLLAEPHAGAAPASAAVLGTTVGLLQWTAPSTSGFVEIETPDGYRGWVPAASLRRLPAGARPYGTPRPGVDLGIVNSLFANVYRGPSFTAGKPILRLSMGVAIEVDVSPPAVAPEKQGFVRCLLPDGSTGFVARADLRFSALAGGRREEHWHALGRQLIGIPYTWGGTSPEGFDCSGLVQFLLKQTGTLVRRDAYEQCFREPRLRALSLASIRRGDLLYFGAVDRVDHVALFLGSGDVLEATRDGAPSVKISRLDEPRLRDRLQYARRLVDPGDPPPAPSPRRAETIQKKAMAIAAAFAPHPVSMGWRDLATGERAACGRDGLEADSAELLSRLRLEPASPPEGNAMTAGIPPQGGALVRSVSHRSGDLRRDTGIVELPCGESYVLAVVVSPAAAAAIQQISRAVWESITSAGDR